MPVYGADVSSYQGTPNWAQAAKTTDFAFAKASEGYTWKDPSFAHNWAGIKSAGLVRGAYHFAHADSSHNPITEAQQFLSWVHQHGGWSSTDIPVLDIEAGGLSGASLDAWIDAWCRTVEKVWRPGLIYSGQWYLGAKGAHVAGPRARGWKLWTAAYGPNPLVFSGYNSWLFWQFTDGKYGPSPHAIGGIGSCDISRFNGTVADLKKFAGVPTKPAHGPSRAYVAYLKGRLKFRRAQRDNAQAVINKLVKQLRDRGVANP